MATLTFAGGVVLEPPSFSSVAWPFYGDLINPFQGQHPIPFYAVVLEPPATIPNSFPYNGGTISPARGGSAVVPLQFYWGGIVMRA